MERETLLRRDGFLVGIAGFSLLNGMHFSPYFDAAYILLRPFTPTLIVSSPILTFYFTSLFLSVTSLIIAGIPAALFERMTGRRESDAVSLGIWLAGVLLLALPVLLGRG
ncbi:MAG: hypothetical protein LDL25_02525 [Hyphomicrobiales bacterium]|jgi:hypothetical protein|uniref:hypothetical protein n=1 Tax=Rhabdaerophilum calidifontis TaxID=2604328 RepID=UPI001238D2F8|nr:hypothetical protein [Rhabdaerophilum calidifontis]MCA1952707.1 hypothetical protein [Hyphomicrobiales bacterium]MCA1998640.1 hypothetical protein [Hyphomicrobiales bacterium]